MISLLRTLSLVLLSGALLVAGCGKYRPHMLSAPQATVQKKRGLEVTAKALTEQECKHYFSRRILKHGFQPIQLMIHNTSNHTYILDAANIELELEPTNFVARRLRLNTTGRVVLLAIPGLILWPLYIPAIVEGCRSSEANKELVDDFAHRTINVDAHIVIHPGAVINRVMFITQENYRHDFNIHLLNKDHDDLIKFELKV